MGGYIPINGCELVLWFYSSIIFRDTHTIWIDNWKLIIDNFSLRLIKLKQVLRYAHQQDSRKYKSCLEDSTIHNPVHTRETKMCGGDSANPQFLPGGSTPPIRYSLPGWLVDGGSRTEGILSFVEYAPRLRMVLPSRQLLITRLAKILKSILKILAEKNVWCASHFVLLILLLSDKPL